MVQSARNESVVGIATDNRGASPSARPALDQELGEIARATSRLASEMRPLLDDKAAALLDKLVRNGEHDVVLLQQRQRALYEMVLNAEIAARGELRSLEQQSAAARTTASDWAQAAEDLKRFNTLPTAIM